MEKQHPVISALVKLAVSAENDYNRARYERKANCSWCGMERDIDELEPDNDNPPVTCKDVKKCCKDARRFARD